MAKIYKGAFSGTLPVTVSGTGAGVLASYRIYGNTVQDGTPTSENPIVPSGCGERTENLISCVNTTSTTGGGAVIDQTAGKAEIILSKTATNTDTSLTINVLAELSAGTYTLSVEGIINRGVRNLDRIYIRDEDNNIIVNSVQTGIPQQFTVSEDVKIRKLSFVFAAVAEYSNQMVSVMLNAGSTALPYEPYGYKLPLTANGVEYPIYLGESQTTRRIKKLVLTGKETSYIAIDASKNIFSIRGVFNQAPELLQVGGFCTHYKYNNAISSLAQNMSNGDFVLNKIADDYSFTIRENSFSNDTDFKQYVQQQYANGTPVTIWYILAKPETGIVNEPLMKIGDYADTIDSTQSTAQIPTAAGTTIIEYAGEGLAPSQFDGVAGWGNLPVRKLKGVPYTGTLPATLTGTKAGYLESYKIYGNTEQDGTPTPENPIVPSGCGVRTENLFDEVYSDISGTIRYRPIFVGDGTFTLSTTIPFYGGVGVANVFLLSGNVSSGAQTSGNGAWKNHKVTAQSVDGYVTIAYRHYSSTTSPVDCQTMLNLGSTALPYEPYGYKLPLTANGVEYPIYLGESQTTRRIKKLVLTGGNNESWSYNATYNTFSQPVSNLKTSGLRKTTFFCTHYIVIDDGRPISKVPNNAIYTDQVTSIYIMTDAYTSVGNFKSYLAAQYAAGTPVTVWYVLAEPETAVVNEPLMKIGDYADTIDSTQTNVQIPTAAGETTISWAGEGLAPSEFDSIQEWVDIPTYTRVNGKWIADSETIIYGIHVDPDEGDPSARVTYLEDAVGMTPAYMGDTSFNYGSWQNAFFMPKPCVLNYDGTVAYYLDPNDYAKKIDGTASNVDDLSIGGNVMLEFPKIWFKFVANASGNDGDFYVANKKVDDSYECWCNYDADNNEIDHFYIAAYNGCCYDGKMRSISGLTLAPWVTTAYSASSTYAVGDKVNYNNCMYKCTTAVETAEAFDPAKWEQYAYNGNTSGTEEIARAKANNTTAKDEWMIDLWADANLIWGLLYLISKSTDVQAAFGRGIDSGSQAVAEAYVTGSLNDKGLFYGSTANGSTAVKVFGIENFWACKWRRCVGLIGTSTGISYKLTHGTKDGSSATAFNTNGSGYLTLAYTKPSANYVKNMNYGKWGIIAKVTGSPAASNKYYYDYFYPGTGFALFGGFSNYGTSCGVCAYLDLSVGVRAWVVAAAPSCKPLASR